MNMQHQKNAFTLIELLVVIAIISLLVSILLPSLQAAKEQARITKCLATLRSFGLAMNMYAGENDGSITPDFVTVPNGNPNEAQYFYHSRQAWPWLLAPYLDMGIMKTDEWGHNRPFGITLLTCPSAGSVVADDPQYHAGYAMNLMLDQDRWNSDAETYVEPKKLDDLKPDLIYLGDGTLLPMWNSIAGIKSRSFTDAGFSNEDYDVFHFPAYRHNGSGDVYPPAFLDSDSANFVFIGGNAQTTRHEDRDELWIDPSNH